MVATITVASLLVLLWICITVQNNKTEEEQLADDAEQRQFLAAEHNRRYTDGR